MHPQPVHALAAEQGQQRGVNVHNAHRVRLHHLGGQQAHVAREANQVGLRFLQHPQQRVAVHVRVRELARVHHSGRDA
jgi:hypothetical protein